MSTVLSVRHCMRGTYKEEEDSSYPKVVVCYLGGTLAD